MPNCDENKWFLKGEDSKPDLHDTDTNSVYLNHSRVTDPDTLALTTIYQVGWGSLLRLALALPAQVRTDAARHTATNIGHLTRLCCPFPFA